MENENGSERILVVNLVTQSMIVIEGRSRLEALLRDLGGKEGHPSASKASIQALPTVQVKAEELPCECPVCLNEWEIGCLAKELPCTHKFHRECIQKWLGIHGTCPVCRYKMPVDEEENDAGVEARRAREIWVAFSFNNDRRVEG
ncbi:E3 ubiquitin-protein ligase RING1-like [Cucurbita maxima]|uniref:RING-type E3 ubiquitin transferase n=1 Tax=Cucurbita maxima TaxID=3661 RepID=A0A6J1I5Z1_CUCMA|nr:E3 ubiquitin-protein ligase RING1-like [Cucurbita maxima]